MLHALLKLTKGFMPRRPMKPFVFHPVKPLLLPPRHTKRLFEVHHGIVIVTPLDKLLWNMVEWYKIDQKLKY
jgi:hypothetical protein